MAEVETIDTARDAPYAGCTVCSWRRDPDDGLGFLALRAAARRHVASTGHPTVAGVRSSYLYAPRVAGRRERRP